MTRQEMVDAYARFGHLVFHRCRRIVRDAALAEDMVQEVFLKLWRNGDGFLAAESRLAWLYTVADRCCFDALDRRRRAGGLTPAPEGPPGLDGGDAYADRELVLRLLGELDDRVRRVVVLYYVDEQSQDEIAAATGWSRQTIWKKLGEVRARAARLAGRGGAA